jgi:hypothetical protein
MSEENQDKHFFDVVAKVRPLLYKVKTRKILIRKSKNGFYLRAKISSEKVKQIGLELFQLHTEHILIHYDFTTEILEFRYNRISNPLDDKPISDTTDSNGKEFSPSDN